MRASESVGQAVIIGTVELHRGSAMRLQVYTGALEFSVVQRLSGAEICR